MISLKRHIDRLAEEQLAAAIATCRGALSAMGSHGAEVCPPLGRELRERLEGLARDLSPELPPGALRAAGQQAEACLGEWSSRTRDYFRRKTDDVKELMLIMAQTAQSLGERDQRYNRQFSEFTGRLRAVADLDDLDEMRQSLIRGAGELKACVDAMASESKQTVARLEQELAAYRERLKQAEHVLSIDPLTGLLNRRGLEIELQARIVAARPLTLLMLDLNGFKEINDRYGHAAGDEVLRQFSQELRAQTRPTDTAGRWGGDEFLLLIEGTLEAASKQQARLREWVFGDYTVDAAGGKRKLSITAAMGAAEWRAGESAADLVNRADSSMYRDKPAGRGRRR